MNRVGEEQHSEKYTRILDRPSTERGHVEKHNLEENDVGQVPKYICDNFANDVHPILKICDDTHAKKGGEKPEIAYHAPVPA
jgi:hypothetical protein